MERTELEKTFNSDIRRINNELFEAQKKEEYYKSIGETGERAEIARFERIKYQKIAMYLEKLKDLPKIHDLRYASNERLEELRKIDVNALNQEEYGIESKIEKVKKVIDDLILKESSNASSSNVTKKLENGKRINKEIYETKKRFNDLKDELNSLRNKRNYLKNLDYDDLRTLYITKINGSSEMISLEEKIKNEGPLYDLFSLVKNNPKKVKELSNMIMELDKYRREIYPKEPKFAKSKIESLHLPVEFMQDIFENPNIYSKTTETVYDADLAIELMKEYMAKYNFDKNTFNEDFYYLLIKGGPTYNKLLKYLHIQECKDHGIYTKVDEDEENYLLDYFSKDHFGLINDLLRFLPYELEDKFIEENYSVLSSIGEDSEAMRECVGILSGRKKLKQIGKHISVLQIEVFKNLWNLLKKEYDIFDILDDEISLEKLVSDCVNLNKTDFSNELSDIKNKMNKTLNTVVSLRDEFKGISELNDENFEEYNNRLEEKINEIEKFAGAKCNNELLVVSLKGNELVDYIYDKAAINYALLLIEASEKSAKYLSFEEEAKLRNMSQAELFFTKMQEKQEESKAKTLKYKYYLDEDIDE